EDPRVVDGVIRRRVIGVGGVGVTVRAVGGERPRGGISLRPVPLRRKSSRVIRSLTVVAVPAVAVTPIAVSAIPTSTVNVLAESDVHVGIGLVSVWTIDVSAAAVTCVAVPHQVRIFPAIGAGKSQRRKWQRFEWIYRHIVALRLLRGATGC